MGTGVGVRRIRDGTSKKLGNTWLDGGEKNKMHRSGKSRDLLGLELGCFLPGRVLACLFRLLDADGGWAPVADGPLTLACKALQGPR